MGILNFKEIPEAHGNGENGLKDTFELFAESFFISLGFKILVAPSRGTDNGKDLIIEESIQGKLDSSEQKVKWLVSCKHKAHTGNSVKPDDEQHLLERISLHKCDGFIGFYSTLASSGLDALISGLPNHGNIKTKVFNVENIEAVLLQSRSGIDLVERFFPQSFLQWRTENPEKAKLFKDGEFELKCMCCNENLIKNNSVTGNYYLIVNLDNSNNVVDVRWSCNGKCDDYLNKGNHKKNLTEFWDHIECKATPVTYLMFIMEILNKIQNKSYVFSDDAFKNIRHLICAIYPLVARNMTTKEQDILDREIMMHSIG